MNLLEDITIVIPTYNRYAKLARLLSYYQLHNFNVRIVILDSSSETKEFKRIQEFFNNKLIEIINYPSEMVPGRKILGGLLKIDTPYTVICADDDFITPIGINNCVVFLKNNQDYVLAQGESLSFILGGCESSDPKWRVIDNIKSIEFENPGERLIEHLSNYFPTAYGVYRTNSLQSILKLSIENTNDLRFFELLSTSLTALYGKIKRLNVLYSVREISPHSGGHTTNTLIDFIYENKFDAKYLKFKKCLMNLMLDITDIKRLEKVEYGKVVDKAFKNYFTNVFGSSPSHIRIKWKFKNNTILALIINLIRCRLKKKKIVRKLLNTSEIISQNKGHDYISEFSCIINIINSGIKN